jgi:hypothetical protein
LLNEHKEEEREGKRKRNRGKGNEKDTRAYREFTDEAI